LGKEETLENLKTVLVSEITKELAKSEKNVTLLDVLNRLLGTVSSNILTKK
jgi:hypothetical protein